VKLYSRQSLKYPEISVTHTAARAKSLIQVEMVNSPCARDASFTYYKVRLLCISWIAFRSEASLSMSVCMRLHGGGQECTKSPLPVGLHSESHIAFRSFNVRIHSVSHYGNNGLHHLPRSFQNSLGGLSPSYSRVSSSTDTFGGYIEAQEHGLPSPC
jgi:hypothetical protein